MKSDDSKAISAIVSMSSISVNALRFLDRQPAFKLIRHIVLGAGPKGDDTAKINKIDFRKPFYQLVISSSDSVPSGPREKRS